MPTKLPVTSIKAYGGIVRVVRGAKSTLYPKVTGIYYEYHTGHNRYQSIVRLIKLLGGKYNLSKKMYVWESPC